MDAEQFSLKWNNFHSNLANGFHVLLQDKDLVDVTLAVDGQLLHAHKIVLSVCSPYFKQMFKIQPEKHPICILRGVTYSDLSNILQFMYQGEVNVRQEDLANFLKTAELLQIKGLTDNEPQFQYEPPPIESSLPIPLPLPIQKEQRPKVERSASPYCSAIITEPPVVDLAPTPPPVIPVIPTQSTIDKKRPAPSRSQTNSKRTKSEIDDLSPPESVDATPKTEPIDLDSDDYDDTSATLGDGLQHFFESQKDALNSSMLNMSSSLQESALSEQVFQVPPKFVRSRKGKTFILIDGFTYSKEKILNNQKIMWKCSDYKKYRCMARCHSKGDEIWSFAKDHNHFPDWRKIQKLDDPLNYC